MNKAVTSLLLAVGSCTWLYSKLQRRNGNNTQQSLIVVGILGVFIFAVMLSILTLFK